ncbi:site-specific recombinase [Pseudobdellovibrio exovorus]|uniref:Site-specific recombinase n=1 Tax=Pseudobdellovibrio exovorus JSS TaxID=1184267 RepID=M4VQM2_9BACT|nr:site-specific recombinase [Pseudobdellovibrio exovorus]AGH95459.1 hypothetical protein A11Q_1243 [Pseudobdellovibrio exovorus JSS]
MDILSSLLAQNSAKRGDLDKVFWLVSVMKWLQRPRSVDEKNTKKESIYTVRLKYLLSMLNKNPDWKQNFVNTISALLVRISSVSQFTNAGNVSTSFTQEFISRIQEKFLLPKSPVTDDLMSLLYEIFPDSEESQIIDFIDESVLAELISLFAEQKEVHQKLQSDLLAASYVLSVQLLNGVFSLQKELDYFNKKAEKLSEFHLEGILREHQMRGDYQLTEDVFSLLAQMEKYVDELYSSMQTQGVKVELVYLFQTQKRKMRRLKVLLSFLHEGRSRAVTLRVFLSQLILDSHHQRSFSSFLSENMALITERIVQANSHIGEHYVTFSWKEFRKMFRSAMGGGAVTALTVFLKNLLAKLHLQGFIKGFAESLNYSGSFLLIQVLGMTLATKQPSATAPYIAAALKKSTTEARRSMVALLRTQFIAVLGNLSMVIPICFVVSWLMLKLNHPLMTVDEALNTFSSTDILGSAPLFATFTGCLLFMASLIAGWFENWVIVNRVGQRLKFNERLRKVFGVVRTERIANFVDVNANALAANISLGFLLGMTPQFLKFLGIPLDVKHVTLATGGFATSIPIAIGAGVDAWDFVNSILGIISVGILNISVSFLMAFLLASISSKVRFSSFVKLFKSGVRMMLVKPWLLIIPEKD